MFKAAVEYTVGKLSARDQDKNDQTDQAIIMKSSAEGTSPSTTQNRSTIKQSLMTTDLSFNKIP